MLENPGIIGGTIDLNVLRKQIADKELQFKRDSFPPDPIMLLHFLVTRIDGTNSDYYVIPRDYANQDVSTEPIYYDVIKGDSIYEMSFVGCSITIMKVVFSSFVDIQDIASLVVIDTLPDYDTHIPRTSKVLLGVPGIRLT